MPIGRHSKRSSRCLRTVSVVLTLVLHFALVVCSKENSSAVWDEPYHMLGGLSYWQSGDYRVQPENGNLPQRIIGFPLWLIRGLSVDLGKLNRNNDPNILPVNQLAAEVILSNPAEARINLRLARSMVALLSCGLVYVIYRYSADLYGRTAAIGSMLLAAFCPTLLAHGGLATSDVCFTLFFVVSIWMIDRSLRVTTPLSLGLAAIAVAGTFLSKFSAPFLIIAGAAMAICSFCTRNELIVVGFGRQLRLSRIGPRCLHTLVFMTVCALVTLLMIWGAYSFRYHGLTVNPAESEYFRFGTLQQACDDGTVIGRTVKWIGDCRLLPEAYLYGAMFVARSTERYAFFMGDYRYDGWWNYFPTLIFFKTPIGTLLIWAICLGVFALATWQALRGRRRSRMIRCLPVLLVTVMLLSGICLSTLNIGIRHALPAIMLCYVLCGAAFSSLFTMPPGRSAAALGTVMTIGAAWFSFPDYVSAFNVCVPRDKGYRYFVDSNFDWGQDLWNLREQLATPGLRQADEPVIVSYFGPPGAFERSEIDATAIAAPLRPGLYCISATNLIRVYQLGQWTRQVESQYRESLAQLMAALSNHRNESIESLKSGSTNNLQLLQNNPAFHELLTDRLFVLLSARKPLAVAGRTILIYRVSEEDLWKAHFGKITIEDL